MAKFNLNLYMMNYKLIKESLAPGIRCFIYLLVGIILFESCGSDNSKNEFTGNEGNTTNQYLLLQ